MQTVKADIAIIGAGTAGLSAFHTLKAAGKRAVLIDGGPLGTTCARVGCMPSKAILHAGKQWATASNLSAGATLSNEGPKALWREAQKTRDALANGAAERTRKAAGDALILAEAHFVAPNVLHAGTQRIEAGAFIVATGSSPVIPGTLKHVQQEVLTTDTLFELDELPRNLGVLGLGAIGLELGVAMSRLGVKVTAADQRETIGGISDPEVLARAKSEFDKEIEMWLGTSVNVSTDDGSILMQAGERSSRVDKLLVVAGRAPNTSTLNLPAAGVVVDHAGMVTIDPATMQAGCPSIFFAGDVQPNRPLQHEAADEGSLAARAALSYLANTFRAVNARRVPISILFTDPDVCSVGLSHEAAAEQGAIIGQADGTGNGRSKVIGATGNLLRIYVAPKTGLLLGGSMILTQGEHIAHLLAWAIQARQTVNDLLTMPFYHPSIEELLQSALKSALDQMSK